ncbi:hypothetical protein BEWA_002000 [Theileria equi strain WA]|uniref:Uncharacterized protein n=1 Tax=Theileria equi strain WA TaxID=1537102 RepID=L0AZV5_THEEQ|nr:hypothetical protein BEWA_002000 [Theileria equi strain WA]AFZ80793.1 hypothetical protein BEWA_002000 [Theileria equi strain WA]|eukprot:XP_004830459.1 hypothetical protein BEWA_002000 [Theileria equi strain WA]
MVYDHNLDISPKKLEDQLRHGISGTRHENSPKPYTKYEYTSYTGESFILLTVSYNGITLKQIKPPAYDILKFCTYFTENVLVALHIKYSGMNYYYMTVDNSSTTGYNIKLQEFKTTHELDEERELKRILDSVNINKALDYQGLSKKIREKLFGKRDIFFDLHRNHWNEGYASEVTNISIKITKGGEIGEYQSLQHKPNVPSFYIKGLYNVRYQLITLDNGFPNEPLDHFSAYYKEISGYYHRDPMVIILNIQENKDPRCIPGKYIITNDDYTSWSILRTGTTSLSITEISKIVDAIVNNGNKLYVNKLPEDIQKKLRDITKDLILDLTHRLNQAEGIYHSVDGMNIPYKRTYTGRYLVVSHADTFSSFTVKSATIGNVPIEGSLIPLNTRFSRFKAYYNENDTNNPLLIYMMQINGDTKWICRYDGCDQWEKLKEKIPSNDNDSLAIIAVLSSLKVPTVVIDISHDMGLYSPVGSDTKFYVSRTTFGGYYFYEYKQQKGERQTESYPFKISHISHNNAIIYDIKTQEVLSSVGAFYDGLSPVFDNLFLIKLVTYNPKKYWYYRRVDNTGSTWVSLDEQGYSTELTTEQAKAELMKLKAKTAPKPELPPHSPHRPSTPSIPQQPSAPTTPATPKQTPMPSPPKIYDVDYKHDDSESEEHHTEQEDYKDYSSYGHSAGAIIGGIIGCVLCIGLAALGSRMFAPRIKAFMLTRHHLL